MLRAVAVYRYFENCVWWNGRGGPTAAASSPRLSHHWRKGNVECISHRIALMYLLHFILRVRPAGVSPRSTLGSQAEE